MKTILGERKNLLQNSVVDQIIQEVYNYQNRIYAVDNYGGIKCKLEIS